MKPPGNNSAHLISQENHIECEINFVKHKDLKLLRENKLHFLGNKKSSERKKKQIMQHLQL